MACVGVGAEKPADVRFRSATAPNGASANAAMGSTSAPVTSMPCSAAKAASVTLAGAAAAPGAASATPDARGGDDDSDALRVFCSRRSFFAALRAAFSSGVSPWRLRFSSLRSDTIVLCRRVVPGHEGCRRCDIADR